jgi:hypothetical protein
MAMRAPTKPEIDHRTIKLIVGIIALTLANLTSFFSETPIESISASYYQGGWAQSILVGFLFAIGAFLLAYNGEWRSEMVLSKVAAGAALGVALFPCGCGGHLEIIPHVHFVSAAAMFVILAYFCYAFYRRALAKGHPQAKARAMVYAICGLAIVLSILAVAADRLSDGRFTTEVPRWIFYFERTGLVAFGVSWLTASRVLPILTRKDERFSPLSDNPAA